MHGRLDLLQGRRQSRVVLADRLPELDFALPSPTTINNDGANGYEEFKYNLDALLGESVWMQFGKEQFYKFKIVQPALPTMENNLGLQNEYKIIVPRDIVSAETNQKVFIDKIFPIPSKTEKDSEGNFIAYFNIASLNGKGYFSKPFSHFSN
jgi:hypothetical protein